MRILPRKRICRERMDAQRGACAAARPAPGERRTPCAALPGRPWIGPYPKLAGTSLNAPLSPPAPRGADLYPDPFGGWHASSRHPPFCAGEASLPGAEFQSADSPPHGAAPVPPWTALPGADFKAGRSNARGLRRVRRPPRICARLGRLPGARAGGTAPLFLPRAGQAGRRWPGRAG